MNPLLVTAIVVGVLLVTGKSLLPVASLALAGRSERRPPSRQSRRPRTSAKPDELDRLLAPIALYPDALLAQMLVCATKPAKVAALNEWHGGESDAQGKRAAGGSHEVRVRP